MRAILAVSLAAALLGCAIDVVADGVEGRFQKTLAVEGPVTLNLKSSSGSVEVLGVDGDQVEIDGEIRAGWGLSIEEAEGLVRELETNPPVELRDGVVVVGSEAARGKLDNVSISYRIRIPKRATTTIHTSSGSQLIDGVAGPLDLTASSGSVRVRNAERDVTIDVSSGSVEAEDVGGSVTSESSSGSQRFYRIAGGVKSRASSGSVRIEEVGGAVDVRTSSGSVRVRQAKVAPVAVNTSSGSIRVETAPGSGHDLDIRTRSGGIDLPDDEIALTSNEKREKKGTLRGGGPLIALQATSGSVDVR